MYSVHLRYCATHLSLLLKLNSFLSLVLFSLGTHKQKRKKANQQLYINQVVLQRCNLPYLLSSTFETLFTNISILSKSLEMMYIVGSGEWSCCCVIMTHCLRKSICDSPLMLKEICPRIFSCDTPRIGSHREPTLSLELWKDEMGTRLLEN